MDHLSTKLGEIDVAGNLTNLVIAEQIIVNLTTDAGNAGHGITEPIPARRRMVILVMENVEVAAVPLQVKVANDNTVTIN